MVFNKRKIYKKRTCVECKAAAANYTLNYLCESCYKKLLIKKLNEDK